MTESHKCVLDRAYAVEAAEHFRHSLELLNELLDYGTNLVPRAYVSSPMDLKAICVIFVQLRQFLVHLDGVAILAAAGSCDAATLQMRSLLETAHTLQWFLASDTDAKISYLYVANLRQLRRSQSMAIPGTREAARHADDSAPLQLTADQVRGIKDEVARIDDLLSRPPLDIINSKFEATYAKRGHDQEWYKVYAAPENLSIRSISEAIGCAKEYNYFYSPFSRFSHGSDMWRSIAIGDQNVELTPIREPQEIPQVVLLSASLTLRVYRMVLQQYRPGEEENFNRKFVQEWRARYFKQYNFQLVPKFFTI